MPKPWTPIETAQTPDGLLELRQRGPRDFMILNAGRVLMTSAYHRSEVAVAQLGCAGLRSAKGRPAVLTGGAGLGFTLRAALDSLPPTAQVTLAELNPVLVRWCREHLAALTDNAIFDPRTKVFVGDVMAQVRARRNAAVRWNAIIVDLYFGPDNEPGGGSHPLFGDAAVADVQAALVPGGTYAVWGEEPSRPFERRLKRAGFEVRCERLQGPGPHHVVFLAQRKR